MRKLALLTLLGLAIVSCTKEKPIDYFILSGQVENFKKRNITLKGYNFEKRIKFDRKTGTFIDTVRIDRDGYYNLDLDKKRLTLYLTKTDATGVVFDYKNSTVVNFEGVNSNINQYFLERSKKYAEVCGSARELYSIESEEEFLEKVEEYKDVLTELLMSKDLPAEFLKREVSNIENECQRTIYQYESFHGILTGNDEFKVSEDFPDVLEEFSFNSSNDYMDSFSYSKLIEELLKKKTQNKMRDGDDYYLSFLETVQTEVTDTLMKNDILFKNVKSGVTYTSNLKEYYNKYIGYSTNQVHKEEITKDYNKLKTVAKGMPAPKFKDYVNYNGGTTSFDDLLGNGKYLYIDVWATWCSICKKEIPLLKMLEEDYHGKDIEFVSINVDTKDKLDFWKETIENREMTGVQLFSGSSHLRLPWAQKFLIKGLPKFILVDPEGNIVTSNAPAPSQGEKLIDIFNDLDI